MRKRYPDWDPRSWPETFRDPPTRPSPTVRRAELLPVFEQTRADTLIDPYREVRLEQRHETGPEYTAPLRMRGPRSDDLRR